MSVQVLSITVVSYFSDICQLVSLIRSIKISSSDLFLRCNVKTDLYIVDNSCDPEYFLSLKRVYLDFEKEDNFRIILVKAKENIGYGAGNNLVIERLNSAYHLIINPDVVVEPDSLWQSIKYMHDNDDVVAVSPQVIESEGRVHHVIKNYPDCFTLMLRYLGSRYLDGLFGKRLRKYECSDILDSSSKNVELAGGCFFMSKTDVFKKIGGFDERFFMYFEDYDLSIRVKNFGKIAYVPLVKIVHEGGGVGRKNYKHHLFFMASAFKFFNLHGWRLW